MLDFRMETLIAVCETMSFTKAAEKLGITQPAVSQHIRWIEESYGVKLFSYEGKKLKITAGGQLLLSKISAMKHDITHLQGLVRANSKEERVVSFGATLTVGEFMIPFTLKRFMGHHRELQIKMLVANTSELLELLDKGEIDFAIVEGYFKKSEYEHRLLWRKPYVAVCGASYRFDEVHTRLEDLFEHTLIVREEGSGTREILERVLEGKNYTVSDFKHRLEISNMNLIKDLTADNLGITFLYEAAVERELREGKLRKIPLEDFPINHEITYIWRKGSVFSDYYQMLFEEFSGIQKLD